MIQQKSFLPGTFIVIRLVVFFLPVRGWPDSMYNAITVNTECFSNWLEIETELANAAKKTAGEYGRELSYWDYVDHKEIAYLASTIYRGGVNGN